MENMETSAYQANQDDITIELVDLARARAAPRVAWMVQVQLFTMMFEAFCDTVVDNSDLYRLHVLKKNFQAKTMNEKPLGEAEILSLNCMRRFQRVGGR